VSGSDLDEKQPSQLHLLLARADTLEPVLPDGVPVIVAQRPPKPARDEGGRLERPDADPNELSQQRWGVVAVEGSDGDALLAAIDPLREHRRRQQGADVTVYRVPAGQDPQQAVTWKRTVYLAERVPAEERPKYLLLLGDLPQVSLELQQVLAHSAYVGRLHIGAPGGPASPKAYRAYAEKVVAAETGAVASPDPDVLMYCARRRNDVATGLANAFLVTPCAEAVETRWKRRRPGLRLELGGSDARSGRDALLALGNRTRPAVLLSVSHGLGKPLPDSALDRRAVQGSLVLPNDELFSAEVLRDAPFLPGGMWFCFACFGAAVPRRSEYRAWLEVLEKQGAYRGQTRALLQQLPGPGEAPFVSALPQAALANPRGPLAVFGHADLAWNYSFMQGDGSPASAASRILGLLEVLANGSRAGVALDVLMRAYREANDALTTAYALIRDAEDEGNPSPIDPVALAHLWMLRNDLRGYLLLGDPAARLGVEPVAR